MASVIPKTESHIALHLKHLLGVIADKNATAQEKADAKFNLSQYEAESKAQVKQDKADAKEEKRYDALTPKQQAKEDAASAK